MPKINLSFDGKKSANYEIDCEQTDTPQIECSNEAETIKLHFTNENYRLYSTGIKTTATDQHGREILVLSLGRK